MVSNDMKTNLTQVISIKFRFISWLRKCFEFFIIFSLIVEPIMSRIGPLINIDVQGVPNDEAFFNDVLGSNFYDLIRPRKSDKPRLRSIQCRWSTSLTMRKNNTGVSVRGLIRLSRHPLHGRPGCPDWLTKLFLVV